MSKTPTPTSKTTLPAQPRASSATTTRAGTPDVPAKNRYQPGRNRRTAQKAIIEGRRQDTPLILGYGRNLSAAQRTRVQRRLYYIFTGVVLAAVVGVLAFGWLSFNVIQPNQAIVTVNGQQIPQKNYRYMVAYMAQDTWNKLQAATVQENTLGAQIMAAKDPTLKKTLTNQQNAVQTTITSLRTAFSLSQLDQTASDTLIEDQLIQKGAANFAKTDPNAAGVLHVTQKQINDAYAAFGKAFPKGQSLGNFLSQDNLSAQNVKDMIAVTLRRSAMDTYLQSTYVSPVKQVHFERIQYDSQVKAAADLKTLATHPDQWAALAKNSLDSSTRDKSGDLGWVVNGQQDQAVEQWAFDPARKVGDQSGVIKDVGGTFNIVRVLEINNSRAVDPTILSGLKSNALSHWLTGQRDLPPTKISSVNQDMFNNSFNVPQTPNTSVTFPNQGTQQQIPGLPTAPGSTTP